MSCYEISNSPSSSNGRSSFRLGGFARSRYRIPHGAQSTALARKNHPLGGLGLPEGNVRSKAGPVADSWKQLGGNFEGHAVTAFEVENGKDRQFGTDSFVTIGLFKARRIELLQMQERPPVFSLKAFSLPGILSLAGKDQGHFTGIEPTTRG
jgi:hypothetical protein